MPTQIVHIQIDHTPYQSPSPTTGAALYQLAHIGPDLQLYRDGHGNQEDTPIDNGPEVIQLREGDHFHSDAVRGVRIIVEGTPHPWQKPRISYVEVATLFDPTFPQHPDVTYSITYDHGPRQNPEGILSPGGSVKVKEEMEFHVSPTGQS